MTIFKLLEKRWLAELPLLREERKRDRFEGREIKRKVVRAAIGRARTITEEQREKREIEGRREEEPTSQTIIRRIKRVKDTEEIIRATNERLLEQLKRVKRRLRKKTIYIAVDAHDEPYYGKKQQWTVGGRRKQSTNKFTRIVAMYMVHPGRPILLAVSTQKGTEAETAIIMLKELLAFFKRERWKLKRIIVLADGKYYRHSFLHFLHHENLDYVIRAYSSRRKRAQTKRLRTGKNSDPFRPLSFYIIFKRYSPYSLSLRAVAYYDTDGKERYLVTSLRHRSAAELLSFYKRRFRVENAFRDMRMLLLRTCSRDARVRYTLLLLALYLHHLLHYFFFLLMPSFYLTHQWLYPCPCPQRPLLHLLSDLFQWRPTLSFQGGDH